MKNINKINNYINTKKNQLLIDVTKNQQLKTRKTKKKVSSFT